MENQQGKGDVYDKFTWKIENFSKLNTKNLRSKVFKIYGYKWRIYVHPLMKEVDHFSLYLVVADSLPAYGWSRNTYFKLALVNQMDPNKSVIKETQQKFNGGHRSWGTFLVNLRDFYDSKQGYLVKNTCIVEAHVCVPYVSPKIPNKNLPKSITLPPQQTPEPTTEKEYQETEYPVDETSSTQSSTITNRSSQTEPEESTQCSDLTLRDLIDVEGLGPEESAFVPLLEEVCTWHPSLIQSQRNKTRWFKLWAFTSLGQVLHFLKTRKAKDMNEEGCEQLRGLWEELVKSSGFKLGWLEPYVQSALSVQGNLERAERVMKVTQNVADLERKIEKLKEELGDAEMQLEVARRELVQLNKGCDQEVDLNAALDYSMF